MELSFCFFGLLRGKREVSKAAVYVCAWDKRVREKGERVKRGAKKKKKRKGMG